MTKKLRQELMLFNSYQFIFLFLPITLIGYFVLVRLNHLAPVIWLALASLVFYSVSNWQFVLLLLASIAFNYVIGGLLISKRLRPASRFAALTIGVAGDLLTLGYFKYAGFLAANFNWVFSTGFTVTSCFPSAFHSTPSPRSRSWSMPTGAMSRVTRCRIMRCSSPIFRI
jgi:alginate O-acetyltransferase complex protein AlgI